MLRSWCDLAVISGHTANAAPESPKDAPVQREPHKPNSKLLAAETLHLPQRVYSSWAADFVSGYAATYVQALTARNGCRIAILTALWSGLGGSNTIVAVVSRTHTLGVSPLLVSKHEKPIELGIIYEDIDYSYSSTLCARGDV